MKIAFVTGSASGLGLEICRALLLREYHVAMFSRDAAQLEKESAALNAEGRIISLPGDVTNLDRVREAVGYVETTWGSIDIAIANAGIRNATWADDFSVECAKQLMETNYFGMLHLFDAVMPRMLIQKRGCFVGIASLAGIRCLPGGSGYGASKSAMQAFLDTVRLELKPKGIQVVTVNPWFIRTPAKNDGVSRPLVVEPDWAANTIIRGIEAGKSQIEFPLLPSLGWKMLRLLPNAIFAWLFGLRRGRSSIGLKMLILAGTRIGTRRANNRMPPPSSKR